MRRPRKLSSSVEQVAVLQESVLFSQQSSRTQFHSLSTRSEPARQVEAAMNANAGATRLLIMAVSVCWDRKAGDVRLRRLPRGG